MEIYPKGRGDEGIKGALSAEFNYHRRVNYRFQNLCGEGGKCVFVQNIDSDTGRHLDLEPEVGRDLEEVLSSSLPPKLEEITIRADSITSLHPATFKVG
jgi:hypothetical protein